MTLTVSVILSGALLFGTPDFSVPLASQAEGRDPPEPRAAPSDHGPAAIDVPFVAQGPLLCGGAAVAMVERFWGARGVYAEDLEDLVRKAEGGIRTSDLVAAVVEKGYEARPIQHRPEAAFAALEEGIPPILLLESGRTRLHYVVLVGRVGGEVAINDPNFGPARRLPQEALMQRWEASGFWVLVMVPSEPVQARAQSRDHTRNRPATGNLLAAMERLRDGDWPGARELARTVARAAGDDESAGDETRTARRLIATAWYLEGDRHRSLRAWNRLGEPVVDLIRIDGLTHTRHHVAAARASLRHGDVLTAGDMALAGRRMAQLPAVEDARLDYQPLPDGTVEVRASLLERRRWPALTTLAIQAVRDVVYRDATLEGGPFLTAGDRWRISGSGWVEQRFVRGSMSAPAPPLPGIVTVGVEWRRERFAGPAPDGGTGAVPHESEIRLRGSLRIEEWVHPNVRVGTDVAMESWASGLAGGDTSEPTRLVSGAMALRWMSDSDRTWADVRAERWAGSTASFGRMALDAATTIPWGTRREWRLRAGGVVVTDEAPRTLWPGAGTGRIRAPLLRAHDLDDDGVIQGPAFGRKLLHGTVEHRVFGRVGPWRGGASVFLDAAYAAARGRGRQDQGFIDLGAGLFIEAWRREMAVSLAHGSSGWKASARMEAWP